MRGGRGGQEGRRAGREQEQGGQEEGAGRAPADGVGCLHLGSAVTSASPSTSEGSGQNPLQEEPGSSHPAGSALW